jgi:hypothetical protein
VYAASRVFAKAVCAAGQVFAKGATVSVQASAIPSR